MEKGNFTSISILHYKHEHFTLTNVPHTILLCSCHSGIEVALLDHQLQQYKLLTLVACVYVLLSTEDFMDKLYFKGVDQIAKGNFDLLPEVSCIIAHLLFIIIIILTGSRY